MPIAACFLTPEGVVLGTDSAARAGDARTRTVQRLFQLTDTTAALFWGDLSSVCPRALAASLADEFARHPPPTLRHAADRAAAIVSDSIPGHPRPRDRPAFGCCIAGHLDGEPHRPRAFDLDCAARPIAPRPLPDGGSYWGSRGLVARLIWGIDHEAFERIAASRKWRGSRRDLHALLAPARLDTLDDLSLAQAVDWVHTILFSAVHLSRCAGGHDQAASPVHLAVIPCDDRLAWVCHPGPWEAPADAPPVLIRADAPRTLAQDHPTERPVPQPPATHPADDHVRAGPGVEPDLGNEQRTRGRLLRNGVLGGAALLLLAAGLAGFAARSAAVRPPPWWRTIDPASPSVVAAARDLQNDIITELHWTDRGSEPGFEPDRAGQIRSGQWTMLLDAPEVSAWLNVEFPRWLANQMAGARWPDNLRDLQVNFRDGAAQVGVRVVGRTQDRYLSATIHPRIEDDGSLWVTASWVRIGRLPLPAQWAIAGAAQWQDDLAALLDDAPQARRLIDALQGKAAMFEDPAVTLEDGRVVRVLRLDLSDGRLSVTCRTTRDE